MKSTQQGSADLPLKCAVCGKFVNYQNFSHHMITPDSEYTKETWETLCSKHKEDNANAPHRR